MPNPLPGAPASEEAQGSYTDFFQTAATADGNGTALVSDGFNGLQAVEIKNTAGAGTTTVVLEGAFDDVNGPWYSCGYQQIDAIANPARATAAIVVGQSPWQHVFQVLDVYPFLRARISGTSGAVSLTARLYALPQ